jgi:hypothetical protein
MTRIAIAISAVLAIGIAAAASAMAAGEDPDWPCIQRKVPEISSGQVWTGPPLDEVGESWQQDMGLVDLAREVASRRTEMDDARQKVAAFAAQAGADKNRRLTALFAGILANINTERSSIMAGIGRFARRQRALAEKISMQSAELEQLRQQGAGNGVEARRDELLEIQAWDTRIFRERERSLRYVCELPVLLDQRAFALGREIAAMLDK